MHINTNDGYSGDIGKHPRWVALRKKQRAESDGSKRQEQAFIMQRAQLQYALTEESNGHPKTIAAIKAKIARRNAIHQGKIAADKEERLPEWRNPCPFCRVGSGTPCVTSGGGRSAVSHVSRVELIRGWS